MDAVWSRHYDGARGSFATAVEEFSRESESSRWESVAQLTTVINALLATRLAFLASIVVDREAHEASDRDEEPEDLSPKVRQQIGSSVRSEYQTCTGCSQAEARDGIDVAGRLTELSLIGDKALTGTLPPARFRQLARVATPETEQEWIDTHDRFSLRQLCDVVQAKEVRASSGHEARENRSLRFRRASEHVMTFHGQLPIGDGEAFRSTIENKLTSRSPLPGTTYRQACVDALTEIVSQHDGQGASPVTSAVLVVEERTLRGETTNADRPPTTSRYLIPEGVARYGNSLVGASTLERLLCDAKLDTVVMSGALSVGRATRVVPKRLKRLLTLRDQGCHFPRCEHTVWVDAHHITHWSKGGETDLHNLVHLCPHHHKVVHEDGWEIEGDPNGTLLFRDKRGELLSSQLPPLSHRSKAMIDHFIVYEDDGDEEGESARDGP